MPLIIRATIDLETYSAAGFHVDAEGKIWGDGAQGRGGLPVVGTPNYAAHPTAEVLCLAYDLHDRTGNRLWVPGAPSPIDLLNHVASGGTIEAFNVAFEWWVWNTVAVRLYGWPDLQIEQCVCVMAAARRFSLPGSLAEVAKVLQVPGKDREGGRLIQKLTRPHTPTKKRSAFRWTTATAWEDFTALYQYCIQDVAVEDAAAARIPPLSNVEREIWLVDQHINLRGVLVDTETLDAALLILSQAETKYNAELAEITGGQVQAASELAKLQGWLAGQGVNMPNMQKTTIDEAVEWPHVDGAAHRALRIRQILGSANIKKLRTLKLQVSADGRLRNQYMYCGADRTGRWSAGGVQLQNMTAKGPAAYQCSECKGVSGISTHCPRCGAWIDNLPIEWGAESVQAAIQVIQTGDLVTVEQYWGDQPLDVLCGCLRGLLIAPPGHEFICVDFKAIEAVVAACISRCQWRIDVFNSDRDIYLESFSRISGKSDPDATDRKRGKVAELASGFGGWINSWLAFGAGEYMRETEIKEAILAWRAASPEIAEAWGGQYKWCGPGKWDFRPELFGLEGAVIQAILSPGEYFGWAEVTYLVRDDILYCRLPSGDRKSTRLNSSHIPLSRMPSSA